MFLAFGRRRWKLSWIYEGETFLPVDSLSYGIRCGTSRVDQSGHASLVRRLTLFPQRLVRS